MSNQPWVSLDSQRSTGQGEWVQTGRTWLTSNLPPQNPQWKTVQPDWEKYPLSLLAKLYQIPTSWDLILRALGRGEKNTVHCFRADSQGAIAIKKNILSSCLSGHWYYFFMCRASWNLVLVYRAWKPFLLMVSSVWNRIIRESPAE